MKVPTPSFVKELCNEFVENISNKEITDVSIEELLHNKCMKESEEVLWGVTNRILDTEDVLEKSSIWQKIHKIPDIIVPIIWTVLKNLPIKKSIFVGINDELIYAECSCRVCNGKKKDDDWAKP
ncbi:hypothetical protein C2G38_2241303 [Gigaspora rosea]|uniref:Uncharacterized protein n=1 Tax=Gigaspora rosea TaxID=44941 RepID=A0A397VX89_9GLOM|nr:hypothetical protein C2G38_2241303 [Gigaspora rosea]